MQPKQLRQRKVLKVVRTRNKNSFMCGMCGKVSHHYQYKLHFILGETDVVACNKCAYREKYGTKNMKKAMKEELIEEEKTNS